ncbi:MAG: tetratricopeptide repeat protein [Candidatus Atribacteria bacterium]|nr:MAG: tetratricopeptide repeat protein [Candidatus Atribacteria bacterium]
MRLSILSPVLVFSILIHSSCSQDESLVYMPVTTDSELALEFYETGMLAFDQVKLELAYHNLELAVKEDSDFFMAYFWMYFMSGISSKNIANDALMAGSHLSDGEMQVKEAFKYLLEGQNEKVVEHLQMAIDLYPYDPRVHKILYILQFQYIKDVESAVKSIQRAIAACPDYDQAYNHLGYALLDLKEYDQAEEAFDTYIRMSPNIANPYDSKGDFYMATQQYELAFRSYSKAYEIDPSFSVSEKKALKAIGLFNSSSKD